ncbi:uncharacterized protein LOC133369271 [Rhineura floridana]|uniref:uncharacterized protein LOC133369271 n=1 Tax=Rhineura floridana TaxID=261503 RepID=UPI002AC820BA|nr:uncharacterized protein LOC133369271 [Rhineura floridana]
MKGGQGPRRRGGCEGGRSRNPSTHHHHPARPPVFLLRSFPLCRGEREFGSRFAQHPPQPAVSPPELPAEKVKGVLLLQSPPPSGTATSDLRAAATTACLPREPPVFPSLHPPGLPEAAPGPPARTTTEMTLASPTHLPDAADKPPPGRVRAGRAKRAPLLGERRRPRQAGGGGTTPETPTAGTAAAQRRRQFTSSRPPLRAVMIAREPART